MALATLIFLCTLGTLNAQVFEWAHMGGGNGWKHGNAIAVDGMGNTYVAGEFSGHIVFDDPAATTLTSAGGTGAFIVKYNAAGQWQWIQQFGNQSASVTITAIAVTSSGSALAITGQLSGSVDFGNGNSLATPGESGFIASFPINASNGGMLAPSWLAAIERTGSTGNVHPTGIAIDGSGSVYVCGSYSGPPTFVGLTATPPPSTTTSALFLAKYTSSGAIQWVGSGSGQTGTASASAVAVTSNGAAVTGYYKGTVTMNTGAGTNGGQVTGTTTWNVILATYSSSGSVMSTRTLAPQGPADSIMGRAIAIDPSNDDIYITGNFSGNVAVGGNTLTAPYKDFFIAKFPLSGTALWGRQGNTGLTGDAIGNGIAIYDHRPYITGTFSGAMTLGTTAPLTLGSMGNHDVFVICYETDGSMRWGRKAGNIYTDPERNHYDQGIGIAINQVTGNPYIAGEFGGNARFDAIDLSFQHFRNVFVAKVSTTADILSGQALPNCVIWINEATSYSDYVVAGPDGRYTTYLSTGSFTASPVLPSPYWAWTAANPSPADAHGNGGSFNRDFTFTVVGDSAVDLRVSMDVQTTENAISGKEVLYLITYQNVGTHATINSSTLTLSLAPLLTLLSTNSQPQLVQQPTQSGQPYSWYLPTPLLPMATGTIAVRCSLQANAQDGIFLNSTATVGNTSDMLPVNNTVSLKQEVFQPSDPNGKTVFEPRNIGVAGVRNGQSLTYTVSFYNQGSGVATMVDVKDDLPSVFNVTSAGPDQITPLDWSPGSLDVQFLAHNSIRFVFANANLQPEGHGFVTFSVPLDPSSNATPIGMNFSNQACVTFYSGEDTLAPLCTAPVSNCITADFDLPKHLCIGQIARFSSRLGGRGYLTNDTSDFNIEWDFGDNQRGTGTEPTHQYLYPGTYLVTLTFRTHGTQMCDEYDSVFTISKLIEVSPIPPTPTITEAMGILTSTPAAHYQWYFNGNPIAQATDRTYRPTKPGAYSVRVANDGGCESISATAGISAERPEDRSIEILPNPGNGLFVLDLGSSIAGGTEITITDVVGREIRQQMIPADRTIWKIDLRDQPSGVYTARILLGDRVVLRRFVVER